MRENTRPSIMQNFDTELAALISKSRGVSLMDGLRIFLKSQTHGMLLDNEMRLEDIFALAEARGEEPFSNPSSTFLRT